MFYKINDIHMTHNAMNKYNIKIILFLLFILFVKKYSSFSLIFQPTKLSDTKRGQKARKRELYLEAS